MTTPTNYILVERNTQSGDWRTVAIHNLPDGYCTVQAVTEDPDLRVTFQATVERSAHKPTHILLPDGTFDDGGALTLCEVAEAVYEEAAQ